MSTRKSTLADRPGRVQSRCVSFSEFFVSALLLHGSGLRELVGDRDQHQSLRHSHVHDLLSSHSVGAQQNIHQCQYSTGSWQKGPSDLSQQAAQLVKTIRSTAEPEDLALRAQFMGGESTRGIVCVCVCVVKTRLVSVVFLK